MAARRLSLHPSALSEDEHVLFTAGFAYLARVDSTSNDNIAMDWEGSSVSVGVGVALRAVCLAEDWDDR
jgi:hypothetical protein